jgi:hypothetical protein
MKLILTQMLLTASIGLHAQNIGITLRTTGAMELRGKEPSYAQAIVDTTLYADAAGGLLMKGKLGVGIIPTSGKGLRFMFYPFKGGLRSGNVDGAQWNDANFGFYSTAIGNNTVASAFGSFASGDASVASGVEAFTHGSNNLSSGTVGISMGASCTAAGFASIAMGFTNHANGQGSVALGYRCNAYEDYSVAIGHRATSLSFSGCMVMSDYSTTDSTRASANNQFTSRYAGGYRMFSNYTRTVGVQVVPSGNSWSSISDSCKKENFEAADKETFLQKLSSLKLGSWNYKAQDDKNYRHYGPMAQEIFAAYGHDQRGIIGCDTLLATADMDGIMMILLQGLEKRTRDQETALNDLRKENAELKSQVAKINKLEAMLKDLQAIAKQ